jgi:hypothetical protein
MIAAVLFGGLGALVLSTSEWHRVNDFGRVFSPLLVLIAIESAATRLWWTMLPIGLNAVAGVLPMGEQALNVFRRVTTGN